MIYQDISIKFAPELVELVRSGVKTSTYRLGDKFDFLKVGDKIGVADNDPSEKVIILRFKLV